MSRTEDGPVSVRPSLVLLLVTGLSLSALSWIRFAATGELNLGWNWLPFPGDIALAAALLGCVAILFFAHRRLAAVLGDRPVERAEIKRFAGWGALLAVSVLPMLPLLSDDVFSTLAYSELGTATSVSPYTLPSPGLRASAYYTRIYPTWSSAPCVYGPVQLAFWAPASWLARGSPFAAILIMKSLAFLATVGILGMLAAYVSRQPGPRTSAAMFALLALNPVLWLEGAGQASNELLPAAFLAAWLLLATRDRVVVASAALGLAVASKLPVGLPAGMYVVFLAGRRDLPVARRLGDAGLAAGTIGGMVVLAYLPVWDGPGTLLGPLAFLGTREPTNTLMEPFYIVATLLGADRARTISLLSTIGFGLVLAVTAVGAVLAWQATGIRELAGRAAMILLVILTLASPVFHPWYLMSCLVLAMEIHDPAWRRWLLAATTLVIAVSGTALLPLGSIQRITFTVATGAVACGVWLLGVRGRLSAFGRPHPATVLAPARRGSS